MGSPRAMAALTSTLLIVVGSFRASAQAIVDGTLDPSYGDPFVTQTTGTTLKGYHPARGEVDYSSAAELDGGYGFVSGGVLFLFLAGNIHFRWTIEATTIWLPLDIFIDCFPGGQNKLLSNNPAPDPSYDSNKMAGLAFDSGFTADYWLSLGGNLSSWPRIQAYYGALPTAGDGAGAFLGTEAAGGAGTLTGGNNPFGIQVALNDSNTIGVGSGCGASSGTGIATGVEWAIPLAAIGNPTGCIRVCAFVSSGDHSSLFNQVLGPLPPGTCDLGSASAIDFANIPGDQFFSVCMGTTPTRSRTWGALKAVYR